MENSSESSLEQLLSELKEVIHDLKVVSNNRKEIMTAQEASVFLSLSLSAIYKLSSNKKIPFYAPGGKKIYFRRSDLEDWIYAAKSKSNDEVNKDVEIYLSNSLKNRT